MSEGIFTRLLNNLLARWDSAPPPAYVMNKGKVIILDPGHGMSNRNPGVFDTGATAAGAWESTIAMDWVNELREILLARGMKVVRTRRDAEDPCPVGRRDDIARDYKGWRMISLHCNASDGRASGAETFFRGEDDRELAKKLTDAVCSVLKIANRGPKTEGKSQHNSLAVLGFDKCWLIELGFIDNPGDRAKLLDPVLRKKCCEALATVIIEG